MKGSLTITIIHNRQNEDSSYVEIQLRDKISSTDFATIKVSHTDFLRAMGRLANVPGELEVKALDRVGKKMEYKLFEFQLPKEFKKFGDTKSRREAGELAAKICPKGWMPDTFFSSQSSFFLKDGVGWARATIRRWVGVSS